MTSRNANAKAKENDFIGSFVLELYLQKKITSKNNWLILKNEARLEFDKFLKTKTIDAALLRRCQTTDIGTLLGSNFYLLDTPNNSKSYRIKNKQLLQFYGKKLKEFDQKCKNGYDCMSLSTATENGDINKYEQQQKTTTLIDPALSAAFEVDVNEKSHDLTYQGTTEQKHNKNFQLTNISCYICQLNFASQDEYEDHVEYHGEDSEFKSLETFYKRNLPYFSLSYKVCKKSHNFCFAIEVKHIDRHKIIIEKIILVQQRLMYYIKNTLLPYPFEVSTDMKQYFFVDSHMFTQFLEQPILISFKINDKYYVEQHHFLRVEDFPTVHFAVNPYRLPCKKLFKAKRKTPLYLPTTKIRQALAKEFDLIQNSLANISYKFGDYIKNNKTFTKQNITEVLSILLQIVDIDTFRDYQNLIQFNVKLRVFGRQCSMKVETATNNSIESLLNINDKVVIINIAKNETFNKDNAKDIFMKYINTSTHINENKNLKFYTGRIDSVNKNRVSFECDIPLTSDKTYTVMFYPDRQIMRYQFYGLELLKNIPVVDIERILFPLNIKKLSLPNKYLKLYNERIAENPEQLQAVQNIAYGPHNDAPYIIFGPPGTGKTTTIVEAILQLYKTRPLTKILVAAGSNSACDEVALRLCKILTFEDHPRAIVRIYSRNAQSRCDNIDDILIEHSNIYCAHFYPDIEVLHEYRIIICTLSIVGKLALGNFGKNIFTHMFIDEVGASTQSEVFMALMPMLSKKLRIILAGDHKQLGPVITSMHAKDLGLDISLLECLLSRDCYRVDENGVYDHTIQTRLCRNYRSHSKIVELYNNLYYNNELQALANDSVMKLSQNWHLSPNPKFPIIFHSVFKQCFRENGSLSLCNYSELDVVLDYVKDLLCFGIYGCKIDETDIGIISPYKRQYQLIQEQLNLRNWHKIETGAVETFQGKEKSIIIVSFVRSFTSTLGFLDCPRRLNVTLSRAKSLLVLIGNPKTLSLSNDLSKVIEICRENNTMVGAKYLKDIEIQNKDRIGIITKSIATLDIGNKQNRNRNRNRNNNNTNKPNDNDADGNSWASMKAPESTNYQNANVNDERHKAIDKLLIDLPKVPTTTFEENLNKILATKIGCKIAKTPYVSTSVFTRNDNTFAYARMQELTTRGNVKTTQPSVNVWPNESMSNNGVFTLRAQTIVIPTPTPKPTPILAPKPTPILAPKPTPILAPKPTPILAPKPTQAPKPTTNSAITVSHTKTIGSNVSSVPIRRPTSTTVNQNLYSNYRSPTLTTSSNYPPVFRGYETPSNRYTNYSSSSTSHKSMHHEQTRKAKKNCTIL